MPTDLEKRTQESHPTGPEPILTKKIKCAITTLGFALGIVGLVYAFFNLEEYMTTKNMLDNGKNKQQIEQESLDLYNPQKGGKFFYKITKPGREVAYHITFIKSKLFYYF